MLKASFDTLHRSTVYAQKKLRSRNLYLQYNYVSDWIQRHSQPCIFHGLCVLFTQDFHTSYATFQCNKHVQRTPSTEMNELPLDKVYLNQHETTRLRIFPTIQSSGPIVCILRKCRRTHNHKTRRKCPRLQVDGEFLEFYDWKPVDTGTLLKCHDAQNVRRSLIAVYSQIPDLHALPSYPNGRIPLDPNNIFNEIPVEAGVCTSDFASPPPELAWLNGTTGQSLGHQTLGLCNGCTVSKKRNTPDGNLTSVAMHLDFLAEKNHRYDFICQMKFWQALNGSSKGTYNINQFFTRAQFTGLPRLRH